MVARCPTVQFHCVSLSWFRQWQRWLPVTWAYWIWTVDDGRWRQGHPHSLIIRRKGSYKVDTLISLYFVASSNFACHYWVIDCFAHAIGRFFCPWTMHFCHCMGSVPPGLVNIYLFYVRVIHHWIKFDCCCCCWMLGYVNFCWTVLCYHPYLVSMLFADLLSLHLVTFLMLLFLCIWLTDWLCEGLRPSMWRLNMWNRLLLVVTETIEDSEHHWDPTYIQKKEQKCG